MQIKNITFLSEGETIRGHLLIPPRLEDPCPTIVKCHGFPGSPNQVSGIATELAHAGFLVLTFDFRGVRQSDGRFSYAGEIVDAGNAVSFLEDLEVVDRTRIAIYGASFGGAVAICRAAIDQRIRYVAVRAPVYDTELFLKNFEQKYSYESIFFELSKNIHSLDGKNALLQFKEDAKNYNPMKVVAHIAPRDLLIITGDKDEVIDVEGVKKLFQQAKNPKRLEIVTGADHKLSNPDMFQQTNKIIVEWFRKVFQAS